MHDDYDQQRAMQKNRIRRRGIYLLPNLFTTAALFAGFYAIVQAMNLTFDQAAIAIFVAMVLDSLDGRVARLTKTQSAFGAEYDSLSDMVSFGAAPALVMYEWVLRDMGKLGWIAAFIYCAGTALRLARFNTMLDVADKRWFTGIPSPAAAALVAGCVFIVDDYTLERVSQKNRIRRRGIYLLPNLFTTAALFAGFYAIVQAMNLTFDQAAIAIFVAMVLDSLDGRVARLTKTQSAFGAEYDSLSDMVSFGAAPALVMYEWVLRDMGKLGWIAAFVYCAGTALRLARFNTMLEVADKRWFMGIPSPAAAALVAGCVFIVDDYNVDPLTIKWWAWGVTVFAGLTMVSNLKYWSFKSINLKKSVPFVAIFLIVLALALLSYQPAIVLFAGFVAYAISGYVVSGWQLLRRRRAGRNP